MNGATSEKAVDGILKGIRALSYGLMNPEGNEKVITN